MRLFVRLSLLIGCNAYALRNFHRRRTVNTDTRGSEILLEAHFLVNCDRGQTYGHPSDDYRKVRDILQSLTGISLSVEQAVLFLLAMKIARIRTHMESNSFHRDSVVDAAGYLACLAMVIERSRATIHTGVSPIRPVSQILMVSLRPDAAAA